MPSGPKRFEFEFWDGSKRYGVSRYSHGDLTPVSPRTACSSLRWRLNSGSFGRDATLRDNVLRWLNADRFTYRDDDDLISTFLDDVASGWIRVYELESLTRGVAPAHGHESTDVQPVPAAPSPPSEPIVDDERSLLITRCDPALEAQPLAFTYLIRGLSGRPSKLRITSETFPGRLVHERALTPSETTDGSHDLVWDGVVTAAGELESQRLPHAYSPAKVEIVHDDIYRDAAEFTISRRKIVIIDIGGFCFDTDREVLLPDIIPLADEEPGPLRVPAIEVAAAIYRFASAHPEKSLFIAGHTDTVGRHADNRVLSEHRARNVHLYLSGDHEAWAEHCSDNYEVFDQQRVLAWIARTFPEYDCDPGKVDGDMGPVTRGAQNRFRQRREVELGIDLPSSDRLRSADWRQFAKLYDRAVTATLADGEINLEQARARLVFADPAFAGFGESYPSDQPHLDDLDSERNRRVEVIFLDEPELELASDASGESLYGEHADVVREHIPLGFAANSDEIALRFLDEFEQPIGDLQFDLATPDGRVITCSTDARGESRVADLPRGTCQVRLRGVDAIDWEAEIVDQRTLPPAPAPTPNEYVEPDEDLDWPIDEAALHLVFDDDDDDDDGADSWPRNIPFARASPCYRSRSTTASARQIRSSSIPTIKRCSPHAGAADFTQATS